MEEWAALRESRRSFIRVRLMDLERSVPHLTLPLRQAVILHGMLGYSTRDVAKLTDVRAHTTIARRYVNGLEQLMTLMNGG